jgi:CRP-like cAMP-binding protein
MKTIEEILTEHPLFQGMEQNYLEWISGCASNTQFRSGEFIFHEGEDAHYFYIIRHGKVTVETFAPGRGAITFQVLKENDVLGWSWLFPPHKWAFDARALDLTRALIFDGRCLRGKFTEDPRLGYELMQRFASVITQRLQATRMQLMDLKF